MTSLSSFFFFFGAAGGCKVDAPGGDGPRPGYSDA